MRDVAGVLTVSRGDAYDLHKRNAGATSAGSGLSLSPGLGQAPAQ